MRKQLKRDVAREELIRTEEAARTEKDFEELIIEWNKWDSNADRRQRYYVADLEDMTIEDVEVADGAVVPQPLDHRWWRQMMHGNFIDIIFDCPYDLHELTSSKNVIELVKALNDNQREVLFFRAIWQWSPQRIAAMRGQTDRNIRKVYDVLIESLRKNLHFRLLPRYEAEQPLTPAQNEFVKNNIGKYGSGKQKKKHKKPLLKTVMKSSIM